MPGPFNVPAAGIYGASLDEILDGSFKGREEDKQDGSSKLLNRIAKMGDPYLLSIKGPDGKPILETDLERDAAQKIASLIEQVPAGKPRRKVMNKIRQSFRAERRADAAVRHGANRDIARLDREIAFHRMVENIIAELGPWHESLAAGSLGEAAGSMVHKFRDALASGSIADLQEMSARATEPAIAAWEEVARTASVFTVEHNWAAAFAGAQDYDAGEVRLPDDVCAFEFHIAGHRVIAFAIATDGAIILQHAVHAEHGWCIYGIGNEGLEHITRPQVRAIAIALDAAVAASEVVAPSAALNRSRERAGKTALSSYRVVVLSHRSRSAPVDRDPSAEPGTRRRLHFRRGHWRHHDLAPACSHSYRDRDPQQRVYCDRCGGWKRWINWQLVGDPDLGFVDKHYRL